MAKFRVITQGSNYGDNIDVIVEASTMTINNPTRSLVFHKPGEGIVAIFDSWIYAEKLADNS